jgi:hypothetical protein
MRVGTLFFLMVFVMGVSAHRGTADPIYRWEGADGTIHYSSEPPTHGAQPADLPRITRGRLGMKPSVQETCDPRGGVNCQAGADLDGSVICNDGYKEVKTPFRFYCNSPKLRVNDVSDLRPNGDFTIYVRNSKSVAALNPSVIVKTPEADAGIMLQGPEKIEPFEVGEFIYDAALYGVMSEKPRKDQLTVSCANCD